jgi:hypothetical protein
VKSTKDNIHAFIVRIWIEHQEANEDEPLWRGVIEHVKVRGDDEKSVYFDHLDKLSTYFAKYLEKIGVRLEPRKR